MKGYIGVAPSNYLDEQGFFKTGDLGYYDEDKYFYIVERLKEIIVYDGYKVHIICYIISVHSIVEKSLNRTDQMWTFINITDVRFEAVSDYIVSNLSQHLLNI